MRKYEEGEDADMCLRGGRCPKPFGQVMLSGDDLRRVQQHHVSSATLEYRR
jgi:hypothetical protein